MTKPQPVQYGKIPPVPAPVVFGKIPPADDVVSSTPGDDAPTSQTEPGPVASDAPSDPDPDADATGEN